MTQPIVLSSIHLEPRIQSMITLAKRVRFNAHAPHSKFLVGAAVMDSEGSVYEGCNVETSSYGLTICAERNATFAMIAKGGRGIQMVAVVTETWGAPCGACREVLADLCANVDECLIFVASTQHSLVKIYTVRGLLPLPFTDGFK